MPEPPTWAAGAVILRRRAGAKPPKHSARKHSARRWSDPIDQEVCLVHRPRYDDWTLPKGKAEANELLPLTAVREVAEETGTLIRLGPQLATLRYLTLPGEKIVAWWWGQALVAAPRPADHEIDQVVWLSYAQALERLTYSNERAILEEAVALPETTPLALFRHAKAVARKAWTGPDLDRPIDERGQAQVPYVTQVLQAYGVAQIMSSPAQRCLSTVADYAERDGFGIVKVDALLESETGDEVEVGAWVRRLARTVGRSRQPTVVCSHRRVLPALLTGLGVPPLPLATAAGLIAHVDSHGRVVRTEWQETVRVKV